MHFGSFGFRNNPCTQHVEHSAAELSVSAGSSVLGAPVADKDVEVIAGDCNTVNCTDKSEDSNEYVLMPEGSEQE